MWGRIRKMIRGSHPERGSLNISQENGLTALWSPASIVTHQI
jgi:hypothetical protein